MNALSWWVIALLALIAAVFFGAEMLSRATGMVGSVIPSPPQPRSTDTEDVLLWPDGTWCFRDELREYGFMSDDYEVLHFGTVRWQKLVGEREHG
jgi:hypothetical protein